MLKQQGKDRRKAIKMSAEEIEELDRNRPGFKQ
jgi:hypothetical protein